jgi:hypothetical protein
MNEKQYKLSLAMCDGMLNEGGNEVMVAYAEQREKAIRKEAQQIDDMITNSNAEAHEVCKNWN